jgi:hypothetical protein
MFMKRIILICSVTIILGAGILSGCGPSSEELAVSSDTPKPTPTSLPTEIPPTITPSPSLTPTYTPTPEPQVILLRGAKGCEREHDIIANSPVQLHYGVWGSLGKAYAEAAWDLLEITLTMDGEEIEGEKQPVAADLIKDCGSDVEDSYWIFYIVNIEGVPPGVHYLEVTYIANGVIEDGFGKNHGPGTILTHSFWLNSATED